ncbi:MAG: ABC transporter [Myxococcaceae bacterium]
MALKGASSRWVSALWALGLVSVFVGERLLSGTSRTVASLLGAAMVVLAMLWRTQRLLRADAEHKAAEQLLWGLNGLGVVALLVYLPTTDLFVPTLATRSPRLATTFTVLFPLLGVLSVLGTLLAEMSYASVAVAPRVETRRVREAARAGLALAFTLAFAFALQYVATERDATKDYSYFRTSKAGAGTQRLVEALAEPIEVALFFPPGNDVAVQIEGYFKPLLGLSKRLQVISYDAAVDLAHAKSLQVTNNGVIVFTKDQRKERVYIATEMDKARGELRKLDEKVQKALFAVTRARRTFYVTTGHRELPLESGGPNAEKPKLTTLRAIATALNQDLRPLSAAEGLSSQIPETAAGVFVLGPKEPLLPEEVGALTRYFESGGRLLIAADPEAAENVAPLLKAVGLSMKSVTLANDQVYVRTSGTRADMRFIVTGGFSSHPSVTTLSEAQGRVPVALPGAGFLAEDPAKPARLTVDFTVRARAETFDDANGNFLLDAPAERRSDWPVAAAVTRTDIGRSGQKNADARAIVVADSEVFQDGILNGLGNPAFAQDAFKWLAGEEAIAGATTQEQDVRIQHTQQREQAYFYGTVFLVPAGVLAGGMFYTRRRRARG